MLDLKLSEKSFFLVTNMLSDMLQGEMLEGRIAWDEDDYAILHALIEFHQVQAS